MTLTKKQAELVNLMNMHTLASNGTDAPQGGVDTSKCRPQPYKSLVCSTESLEDWCTFKGGERVMVSTTDKHVRGYSLYTPTKMFFGTKLNSFAGSTIFICAMQAMEKSGITEFIQQSLYHIPLTRYDCMGPFHDASWYVDDRTGIVWMTLDYPDGVRPELEEPTGWEMHSLNREWKRNYGGLVHYRGDLLKEKYPESWKEAGRIAKGEVVEKEYVSPCELGDTPGDVPEPCDWEGLPRC